MAAEEEGTGVHLIFMVRTEQGEVQVAPRQIGERAVYLGRDHGQLSRLVKKEGGNKDHYVVDDKTVSSVHAKIWYETAVGEYYVIDCNSRNGTYYSEPGEDRWECIGDRDTNPVKMALKPLSKIRLADRVLEIVQIQGPKADPLVHELELDEYRGGTVTDDHNPCDMVLTVVQGPGRATTPFVLQRCGTYVIGRAIGPVDSAMGTVGSRMRAESNTPSPQLGSNDDDVPLQNMLLVADPTKKVSRKHCAVVVKQVGMRQQYYLVPYSRNGTFILRKANVPTGGIKADTDIAIFPWEKLVENKMTEFSYGDIIRCGNNCVISTSNSAGPPEKMDPPHLRASSTVSLNLFWDAAISPTTVRAYIVAMSPDGVGNWELIYGGGKLECVKDKLEPATPYYFKIQARNSGGVGEWSDVVPHYTNIDPLAPPLSEDAMARALGLDQGDATVDLGSGSGTVTSPSATATATDDSVLNGGKAEQREIRWHKGKLLGQGAQGQVYVGRDKDNGMLMAVKEMNVFGNTEEEVEANTATINSEIDIMSQFEHPNIVRYLGVNRRQMEGYMVMHIFLEYVPGGSLSTMMKAMGGPLDECVARDYTRQILHGLEYLHSMNIAHRDIKSDNILLAVFDGVQQCKIADFGASTILKEDGNFRTFTGTPFFMAPEVVRQDGGSVKSDIWSTGCTLIEMLTGHPPFDHLAPSQAIYKIGALKAPPNLDMIKVSPECHDFLSACLQLEVDARPTASELLSHPWITGGTVSIAGHVTNTGRSITQPMSLNATQPMVGVDEDLTDEEDNVEPVLPNLEIKGGTIVATNDDTSAGQMEGMIPWDKLVFKEKIGQGGFGVVYRASLYGTDVAVKTAPPKLLESLMQEAKVLRSIRHPNCVLFMGVSSNSGSYAIVTEYMDGGDLHNLIHGASAGTIPLHQQLYILRDTAKGLVFLHSQQPPVVHRDIKLGNIFVRANTLAAKLGDFGLASPNIAKGSTTLRYAAPEVLAGEDATPASDVFSFGLVIWEVITGERPFNALESVLSRREKQFAEASPGDIPDDTLYAPELADVTRACWAVDPADRPTSLVVLETLERVIASEWVATAAATAGPAVIVQGDVTNDVTVDEHTAEEASTTQVMDSDTDVTADDITM